MFVFIAGGDSSEDRTYYIDDIKGPVLTNTASINDSQIIDFSLYPNPADEFIYINSNNINIDEVNIYDLNGRIISNKKVVNNRINLDNISKGVYFVEINGIVKKLLKK